MFGYVAVRLRLPPLVGYLFAGIVVGPFTPGLVADQATIEQLAEIGVALLLFGVGLHFSLSDLLAVWRIAVPGALDRPRLGLSRPMWQHLAATVDVIHHCGAEVNFLQPYPALKAANVQGTAEILRLACDGAVKPVHFVSTIYVFSRFAYPPNTEFYEDMDPIHTPENTFGYTQSKWVSEQMVLEAGRRGVPVYVYRAGRMAGDSRTGACQTYDFVWQVTKVGIEMGAAPVMDMTLFAIDELWQTPYNVVNWTQSLWAFQVGVSTAAWNLMAIPFAFYFVKRVNGKIRFDYLTSVLFYAAAMGTAMGTTKLVFDPYWLIIPWFVFFLALFRSSKIRFKSTLPP